MFVDSSRDADLTNCEPIAAAQLLEGLHCIDGARAPAFLVITGIDVADTARALVDLIEICPSVPFAWAITVSAYSEFIEKAPASRAKTMCLEGLVELTGPSSENVKQRVLQYTRDVGENLTEATCRRLADDGASDALIEKCAEAVVACERAQDGPEAAAKARSAAEAFLLARLESLPETAGLFELNELIAADWGLHGQVEVDLLCRCRRLAVEVDGYYHFCDPEGYRRDRRKDLLLQQHGFLVLRFLADDVVARLEKILDTILASLQWRDDQD